MIWFYKGIIAVNSKYLKSEWVTQPLLWMFSLRRDAAGKDSYLSDGYGNHKAMVFPSVTYGCEIWTVEKVESWRIDIFKLWSWRRLLRIPWTARRSNESILKEINPVYSLEGLMKLKHWLIGKDLDAGKDWGQEMGMTEDEIAGWFHRLNGHESEQTLGHSEGQGSLVCCTPWGHKESDTTYRLNNNNGNYSWLGRLFAQEDGMGSWKRKWVRSQHFCSLL